MELAYDSQGRLTTATDTRLPLADFGGQSFAYGYGPDDRLTTVTYPDGETMSYGYDAYGRRASMTDPDGNQTVYSMEIPTLRRLAEVSHPLLGHIGYTYRADGLIDHIYHYANTDVNIYHYDGLKRLSGIQHYNEHTGLDHHREDYTYNDASVRSRIDVTADGVSSSRMEYGYDLLLRLTDEYRFTGSTQNWGRKYAYDTAGNRTSLARHNGSTTTTITYDAANDWNQIPSKTTPETYCYAPNYPS